VKWPWTWEHRPPLEFFLPETHWSWNMCVRYWTKSSAYIYRTELSTRIKTRQDKTRVLHELPLFPWHDTSFLQLIFLIFLILPCSVPAGLLPLFACHQWIIICISIANWNVIYCGNELLILRFYLSSRVFSAISLFNMACTALSS